MRPLVLALLRAIPVSAGVLLGAACDDCCTQHDERYHVSGPPLGFAEQCPAIVLDFYESSSQRCAGEDSCEITERNPGGVALEKTVTPTAAWTIDVPVVHVGRRPDLEMRAFCDLNQNNRPDGDEPCLGSTSLSAGDHDGVILMVPTCSGRL